MSIKFVSLLAEPLHSAYKELCHSLKSEGYNLEFVDADWQTAKQMLEEGDAHGGAVCGLLYTHLRALGGNVHPLAVPTLDHPRYNDSPAYWTDVVVRAGSGIKNLEGVAEQHWLYNEPGSLSGYHSLLAALKKKKIEPNFSTTTETGSHELSLNNLLTGSGDFTTLDSTFLDFQDAPIRSAVKVIESLGPYPPPLVVGHPRAFDFFYRVEQLKSLPEPFLKFHKPDDADYDVVRELYNDSLSTERRPTGQFFVNGAAAKGRDFTSPEQQQKDQEILAGIGRELLTRLDQEPTEILRECRFHKLIHDGREHHHYLISPEELQHGELCLVGFLSRMKDEVDIKALFDVDAELLDQLGSYEGFITYSPTEYEKGLWANLAVFRTPAHRNHWAANSVHLQAIKDLGPSSYDNVRLHLGYWPSVEEPMEWVATRYLNYTDTGLWRGVRTPRVKCPS